MLLFRFSRFCFVSLFRQFKTLGDFKQKLKNQADQHGLMVVLKNYFSIFYEY